jgi:hypothetical protein
MVLDEGLPRQCPQIKDLRLRKEVRRMNLKVKQTNKVNIIVGISIFVPSGP